VRSKLIVLDPPSFDLGPSIFQRKEATRRNSSEVIRASDEIKDPDRGFTLHALENGSRRFGCASAWTAWWRADTRIALASPCFAPVCQRPLLDTLSVRETGQTVEVNTFDRDGAIRSAVAGLSSPRDGDKEVLASGLLGAKIEESKTLEDMLSAWIVTAMLVARLVGINGITAWMDTSALPSTLVDSLAIAIYAALVVLGTRVKDPARSR